jgi:hypothetical protein
MSPHVRHGVYSLPPRGGLALLGAARRRKTMSPHVRHGVYSLPPEGALPSLGRPGGEPS